MRRFRKLLWTLFKITAKMLGLFFETETYVSVAVPTIHWVTVT